LAYNETFVKGLDDINVWKTGRFNRFMLEPGQWTDDYSMALCVCDQLLIDDGFNPKHLRLNFFFKLVGIWL